MAIRPLASLPRDSLLLPGRLFIDPNGIHNSMTPPIQVNHLRDYRCLPQNFVSAMTASVPLTAVQVTDADLLENKGKQTGELVEGPKVITCLSY